MNKDKLLFMASYSGGIWRAIGFFILAPLLYNGCEYLFNTGNTDGLKYVYKGFQNYFHQLSS